MKFSKSNNNFKPQHFNIIQSKDILIQYMLINDVMETLEVLFKKNSLTIMFP